MRPIVAETKDHAARENAQYRKVRARDAKLGCRFEVWNGSTYVPCGRRGASDTAHIYRRRNCGRVWDHEDVAILACREHHDLYDAYSTEVRVPPAMEERAYRLICDNSKVPPPRLAPPARPTGGTA